MSETGSLRLQNARKTKIFVVRKTELAMDDIHFLLYGMLEQSIFVKGMKTFAKFSLYSVCRRLIEVCGHRIPNLEDKT